MLLRSFEHFERKTWYNAVCCWYKESQTFWFLCAYPSGVMVRIWALRTQFPKPKTTFKKQQQQTPSRALSTGERGLLGFPQGRRYLWLGRHGARLPLEPAHPTCSGREGTLQTLSVKELCLHSGEFSLPSSLTYRTFSSQRWGRPPLSCPCEKELKHGSVVLHGEPKGLSGPGAGWCSAILSPFLINVDRV